VNTPRLPSVPGPAWIAFLVFVAVSLAFPQIDLQVSSRFYTEGIGFAARGARWERVLYHSIGYTLTAAGIGLIATWLYNRVRRQRLLDLDGRKLTLLLGLLILVPGLLVHQGLKEHVGRARAVQLEQFGGDEAFTPAFVPADAGGGSFSSGHAAAGFWLVAVAYCLSGRFGVWTLVALGYAVALSFARVAAGAHFLSDVITSGFLVLIGWFVLSGLMGGSRTRGGNQADRGRPEGASTGAETPRSR
jgi:lipid A 4'-phosphatase